MTKLPFQAGLHKEMLIKILKNIYADPELRNVLGFKGGTAALLLYDLPRMSVDLDFDLLQQSQKETVLSRMKKLLSEFGQLREATEKRFTLFFLLQYQHGAKNAKVEISTRPSKAEFEVRHFLGIPLLVMKKNDMAAGKLSALLTRKKFASRDLFDTWFFLKEGWEVNETVVKEKTGFTLLEALHTAVQKVEAVKNAGILQGLGELIDEKQKQWVKNHLREELIFQLKLYETTRLKTT